MERNQAYTSGLPIQIRPSFEEEDEERAKNSCSNHCRNIFTCFRVSPWVPLLGTMMIAAGLPVWAIFTRKALQSTALLSDTLLGGRTYVIDQLATSVDWVTGLSVIIMSSIVGLAMLMSLLRCYQEAGRRPDTKCGPPGRVSLISYVTIMPPITFGLWLMSIVVSLLIAAQLCWLVLAFMFEAALSIGIRPSTSTVAPQAFYEATDAVLTALVENEASFPVTGPAGARISTFVSGAKQAGVNVCPTACVDLGSFAAVFEATSPCMCSSSEQYPMLLANATLTWKYLVHALAALALMGLADLWLLMNLSAQFAHAKRDLEEAKASGRYRPESRRISDISDAAAVYVTTNPTYSSQPDSKKSSNGRKQDTSRDVDTHVKASERQSAGGAPRRCSLSEGLLSVAAAPASPPPPVVAPPPRIPVMGPVAVSPFERSSPEMAAETNVAAAAAAVAAAAAAVAGAGLSTSPPPLPLPPQRSQVQVQSTQVVATSGAGKRDMAASPLMGQQADGADTDGSSPASRQYNTTAQRYAAYRLRAAQANGGRPPADRVRWAH